MILRTADRRPASRHAFTLMEVLVVVAILLVLASAASIAVFRYLEDAKKDKANMDIQAINTAVKTFTLRNGGTPPDSLDQVLPYLQDAGMSNLQDPWGNQYQMQTTEVNGQPTIVIFTHAPDGTEISSVKRAQ